MGQQTLLMDYRYFLFQSYDEEMKLCRVVYDVMQNIFYSTEKGSGALQTIRK
jgi:hypothetical protein